MTSVAAPVLNSRRGVAALAVVAQSGNAQPAALTPAGVAVARANGLVSIGTLGLLDQAAARRLIDFAAVAARLTATNFRYPPDLLDVLLARHQEENPGDG